MKLSLHVGKFNLSLGASRFNPLVAPKSDEGGSTVQRSYDPIRSWLRGEDVDAAAATLVSPFQQSVWVYTAISALAQTVSAIPFRISQGDRSGENLITKGPVVDLFNRPHPFLNRFCFWEFIVTWYCLRGEAFIVALDRQGQVIPLTLSRSHAPPVSLLVLNPDQFRHVVEGSDLVGWNYHASPLSSPLKSMALVPEEVLHDFLPNPYLFWRGMSPLSVALLAAQTDFASAQFMKGLMLNNADAGVIVRSDEQMAPEHRESILSALRERKRSAGTADRPLLLWGTTEVIQPSLSSADLQFLENRKMNRQEICAAFFRIPQSLVGFTGDANRSIAESERLNFLENSITPLCARLEAAIEPVIKAFGQDLVGWFDVESTAIMQQARRSRVDTGVKLFSLGYPANAINKTLDLGLPNLPWGDKGYLPGGLQPAGEIPPPAAPKREAKVFERMLNQLRDISRPSEAANPSDPSETSETHHCSASPAYEARLKPRIKQKRSKLSGFFFDQRNRVLAKLEQLIKGHGSITSLRSSAQNSAPSALKPDSLAGLFDSTAETKLLLKKLTPLLVSDLEFGFAQLAGELALHELTLPSEKALGFVAQAETRLHHVNEATFQDLNFSLQEGLQMGEPSEALRQRVKAIFQDASDRRAETIAGRETNTAVNSGRFFAMQAASVEKKGWRTANDEKVRAAHRQAQVDYAEGIPLEEPFIVGGEALMYPGDPNGSIGNVINCRCHTYPII